MVGRITYLIPFLFILFSCTKEKELEPLLEIRYGQHGRHVIDFKYVSPTCYLFIHGGAWAMGDKSDWYGIGEVICRKGYSYASMNYRLSNETDWTGMDSDVGFCISKLKSLGIKKVILVGSSAGSSIALVHGLKGYDVISISTISRTDTLLCNNLYSYARKYGDVNLWDSIFTNKVTLVHGDMDYITDIEQSRAISRKGHKLHVVNSVGHDFTREQMHELFDFLIK